ncbi:adenine deaminase C-terminal domain-containing protein [Thermodesulfobacteriota bacterium]
MRLATAALPVIPNIKITDLGLVDAVKQEFLELFV